MQLPYSATGAVDGETEMKAIIHSHAFSVVDRNSLLGWMMGAQKQQSKPLLDGYPATADALNR